MIPFKIKKYSTAFMYLWSACSSGSCFVYSSTRHAFRWLQLWFPS